MLSFHCEPQNWTFFLLPQNWSELSFICFSFGCSELLFHPLYIFHMGACVLHSDSSTFVQEGSAHLVILCVEAFGAKRNLECFGRWWESSRVNRSFSRRIWPERELECVRTYCRAFDWLCVVAIFIGYSLPDSESSSNPLLSCSLNLKTIPERTQQVNNWQVGSEKWRLGVFPSFPLHFLSLRKRGWGAGRGDGALLGLTDIIGADIIDDLTDIIEIDDL